MERFRSGTSELEFYRDGGRLYAKIHIPDPNQVAIIEIERDTTERGKDVIGGVRQNPEAYARYSKQIALFKAAEAKEAKAVKPAPARRPAAIGGNVTHHETPARGHIGGNITHPAGPFIGGDDA